MKEIEEITNAEDIIDSRDVIARIEYLESEDELDGWDQDELNALKELQLEAEQYSPDWVYGSTLIRDSYFKDYAQELAEDIGSIDREGWPYTCIDWEQAADELKQDYTQVDFDGVSYWIR
jgi:hypothetical protein